jgi:LacI family transcriptional regulator
MKIAPKLKDVADKAGVSIATASLVLSGKGKISREVSERVIQTAKKIGYTKRTAVSNSGKGTAKYIALLHTESYEYGWSFIRPCIMVLEDILIKHGYFPVIFDMGKNASTEDVLNRVLQSRAGAVLSIHYGNPELCEKLEDMNIPVVIINNSNFQDRFSTVCIDDFQGAYEGSLHLIKLGHRDILYIDFLRPFMPSVITDRFIGFKKALDEYGIPFAQDQRITLNLADVEAIRPKLEGYFGNDSRPTAIFFHDDYIAALVLVILRELGLRVPEDLSIIAPGDVLDYNQPFLPKITTMSSNTSLMAQIAGELLINRLKNDPEDIHVVKVKQQLTERGSCRKI